MSVHESEKQRRSPEPQDLASEAELEAVVDDLKEIIELVEKEEGIEK